MNEIPYDVEQQRVRLLDPVDAEARNDKAVIAQLGHPAAVSAGETDREQPHRTRGAERTLDVRRFSGSLDKSAIFAHPE